MNELISSVNGLKIGKASDPDGILAEMIESTLHEIVPILLPLYNRILSTGQFPAAWSKSILCPLFKEEEEEGYSTTDRFVCSYVNGSK